MSATEIPFFICVVVGVTLLAAGVYLMGFAYRQGGLGAYVVALAVTLIGVATLALAVIR